MPLHNAQKIAHLKIFPTTQSTIFLLFRQTLKSKNIIKIIVKIIVKN